MDNSYQETFRQTTKVNFKHSIGNINIFGNLFHTNYEIFLLIKGDVTFNSKKDTHKVLEKELIIIPPITYHQFIVNKDFDTYERCVLEFNDSSSSKINIKKCLEGKKAIVLKEGSIIYQDFLKLINYSKKEDSKDFEVLLSSLLDEILINIKHYDNATINVNYKTRLSQLASEILDYIDEHVTEDLQLEDIASKLYVSVSTLCHTFKKELDMSILQYITQKRMILAKRLIDDKVKPSIVSSKVGYQDYSTFYRNYMKTFGIAPGETYNK